MSDERRTERGAESSARPRRGVPRWLLALALAASPGQLFADTLVLTFHTVAGGVPLVGDGTGAGIINFGSVSAFEPLGAGVTRTRGGADYTISTQFGVRVVRVVGTSTSYTLRARLQNGRPIVWRVDGLAMNTGPVTVATFQPYGPILTHTVGFVVPFGLGAGLIDATFDLTAIAN